MSTFQNTITLLKNWRFALLLLSTGGQIGIYSAWTGLFDQLLGPSGWSQTAVSNKPSFNRDKVGSHFLMREARTAIKWGVVDWKK